MVIVAAGEMATAEEAATVTAATNRPFATVDFMNTFFSVAMGVNAVT